jgi:GH15 family glucan-1,4-alpha-glucosidase
MDELIAQSIRIIKSGQGESGAYYACPVYPTYRYCWFRDGTFIANAMDLWGEHESAARFYDWAAHLVAASAASVERVVEAVAANRAPDPADLLHTRYTLDGKPGSADWPNFQLDGFGTLLWGFGRHLAVIKTVLPEVWADAVQLLVRYIAALWRRPNFDCWEEFADRIAVSTLAALYAGLRSSEVILAGEPLADVAAETAAAIRTLVLERGAKDGHLLKQIDGEDVVDGSLLWAFVPFGEYALFSPYEPLMQGTAARIESDLVGGTGGVHRYRADTFYGGGEWMLLTALLGEYRLAAGDAEGARRCLAYVAGHADVAGNLPEQSSAAVLAPTRVQEWIDAWGPVAQPLLWSHAGYLSLRAALGAVG